MARLVEVCLYQEAASLETYADVTTLQERLHRLQPHNHPQMLQDQSQDAQAPEGKMPPWHAFRNQPLVAAVNSEAPTGTAACTAAAAGRATDVGNAAIAADAVDWHQLEDHLPHRREMIQRLYVH
jgi:hypothetical protein